MPSPELHLPNEGKEDVGGDNMGEDSSRKKPKPDEIKKLVDDPRPIASVHGPSGRFSSQSQSVAGPETRIEIYEESGQAASVPWIAIFEDDVLVHRIDAAGYRITYEGASS